MTPWVAPTATGPVRGSVAVPGSKSASARTLVMAALADGPSTLRGVLDARDTRLMQDALTGLGVTFSGTRDAVVVTPPDAFRPAAVACGLAGTVMRFVPPIAALASGTSSFTGDAEASARPVAPLLDALRQAGAGIRGTALPFEIDGHGSLRGGRVELDASASSQFVSALLIAGARCDDGLTIVHTGAQGVPSAPYLGLTCGMLADRGVRIETPDDRTWIVVPGRIAPRDEVIEPDLVNAAVFACAALATGGRVEVPWPERSLQPADAIVAALEAFGATIERGTGTLTVSGTLRPADIDLSQAAELTCVLASLACLADGPSRLRGVGHIRGHETDRLAALSTELTAQGARVDETADGLTITPGRLHGTTFHAHADHRMVHAGAVLGLAVPGVTIDDPGAASKTMPDFAGLWTGLVA